MDIYEYINLFLSISEDIVRMKINLYNTYLKKYSVNFVYFKNDE